MPDTDLSANSASAADADLTTHDGVISGSDLIAPASPGGAEFGRDAAGKVGGRRALDRATPPRADGKARPLVVASVGTDHHPFERMVGWMDEWAAEHPEVEVLIQRGTAAETTVASSVPLIPHAELCLRFSAAVAVVTHGGPSTVMDARAMGRLPIVVPRRPERGEHVDEHQIRFAAHLERHGLARVANERERLEAELAAALEDPDRFTVPVSPDAIPGLVAFGTVADRLLGVTTELTVPRSSKPAGSPRTGTP
ncbi:MAG: glycosyltransferase [Acidimicrobiales bacterium]